VKDKVIQAVFSLSNIASWGKNIGHRGPVVKSDVVCEHLNISLSVVVLIIVLSGKSRNN